MTERRRSPALALAAVLLPLLLFVSAAGAAPGDLDAGFDGDGKVVTDSGMLEGATDVVVQPDGKVVAAGGGDVFNLARYNTDGSLDTTFDGDGKASLSIPAGIVQLFAVALQTDGKLVVAGQDGVLARFNADGSLDTSFSGDGIVEAAGVTFFADVEIASDGKIVALGSTVLARYNPDGTPDGAFDGDGMAPSAVDLPNDARLQADGKIVVVGTEFVDAFSTAFVAARYTTSGALDSAFSDDGIVVTDTSAASEGLEAVAVQTDGKIVAAGASGGAFVFVRYTGAGALDSTFDGDGIRLETLQGLALDVEIDGFGKIVAGGCAGVGGCNDFALVRLGADGATETSVTTDFGAVDRAWGAALQADGKIVLAGETDDSGAGTRDFALARYEGGAAAPPPASESPASNADLAVSLAAERIPGGCIILLGLCSVVDDSSIGGPGAFHPGEPFRFALDVRNLGEATATSVRVSLRLRLTVPQLLDVSPTTTQGSCEYSTIVTCNLGTLQAGGLARVVVRVVAPRGTMIHASAEAFASEPDPTTENNEATLTRLVVTVDALDSRAIYVSGLGEANRVGVSSEAGARFDDPAGSFVAARNCREAIGAATCPSPDIETVLVDTRDGDDVVTVSSALHASLFGGEGRDRLIGGGGEDKLIGGLGDDTLVGRAGTDTVSYEEREEPVVVRLGGSRLRSGSAGENDTILSVENALGGEGGDRLVGNPSANRLDGGPGTDDLLGAGGDDVLLGGGYVPGPNQFSGGNALHGGAGDDQLSGRHRDHLYGGEGDDLLLHAPVPAPGRGVGKAYGGPGEDTVQLWPLIKLFAGTDADPCYPWMQSNYSGLVEVVPGSSGGGGVLRGILLCEIENAIGSDGSDVIRGSSEANRLKGLAGADGIFGGGGDDVLVGGLGADILRGDDGIDVADYGDRATPVRVSLNNAADDVDGDNVGESVENVIGGSAGDLLVGSGLANLLRGAAGSDTLRGGDGADELLGGSGDDVLFGGPGSDQLFGGEGRDVIYAADGFADVVRCGGGLDSVVGDPIDSFVGCERIT